MKKAPIGFQQSVVADRHAPEIAQPPDRTLDDPTPTVAPEFSPILMGGLAVVATSRDDRLNPSTHQ
jgi:hypothetical protein